MRRARHHRKLPDAAPGGDAPARVATVDDLHFTILETVNAGASVWRLCGRHASLSVRGVSGYSILVTYARADGTVKTGELRAFSSLSEAREAWCDLMKGDDPRDVQNRAY